MHQHRRDPLLAGAGQTGLGSANLLGELYRLHLIFWTVGPALKTQTDRDLTHTCIHSRAADDAERRRCEVGIWVRKLRMVE